MKQMKQLNEMQALLRARTLSESGLGRMIRQSKRLSLREVQAECARRGAAYSLPNISRVERGLRRPAGEAGVIWGRVIDELLLAEV